MGKIRIRTLGEEEEEKQKKEAKKRGEIKKQDTKKKAEGLGKAEGPARAEGPEVAEESNISAKPSEISSTKESKPKAEKTDTDSKNQIKQSKYKQKITGNKQSRSKKYQSVVQLVDKKKAYPLSEALELLPKLKIANFDETVELHINTIEQGISGNFNLPHGSGKKTRVAIANDEIIKNVEKGTIDFDVLVAEPSMMSKLAKVAKILGPKGLMPNPKNGTISQNPEEVARKYEGGHTPFKTEAKSPIIHLTVGKLSFGEKKLEENIEIVFSALPTHKIKNVTLKSTMSPGIKILLS